MLLRALIATLVLAFAAGAAPRAPLRILFIGNSLTYSNDLPGMVARIGAMDGRRVVTQMVALPNYALEDHLRDGRVQDTVAKGRWDIVVLQQGPSSLGESRRMLIRDVKQFAALPGVKPNALVAVLMVWPPLQRKHAWADVAEAHRLAAEAVGGTLIPAGAVMQTALLRDDDLQLFGPDGFHPSVAGTYLAALTTYRALGGAVPDGAGTARGARRIAGAPIEVRPEQLRLMLDLAQR